MHDARHRVKQFLAVLAAAPLAAGLGCALFAGPPEPAPVVLTFLGAEAGCASAEPEEVEIWREEVGGKPHQVEWTVAGYGEYRWVLTRAGEKAGGDHFPRRQIRCGEESVRSGRPMNLPGEGHATWTYLVEVYECAPDARPEPICVLDPTIFIRD